MIKAEKHAENNIKLMKELEKREKQLIDQLQNTYAVQNKELEKMEQVMNQSKQGFYKRVAASVYHNNLSKNTTGSGNSPDQSPRARSQDKTSNGSVKVVPQPAKTQPAQSQPVQNHPIKKVSNNSMHHETNDSTKHVNHFHFDLINF